MPTVLEVACAVVIETVGKAVEVAGELMIATVAVAVMTIIGGFAGAVRWLVKHYLNELKPNGGSSLKDSVKRLEERIDDLYRLVAEK